MAVIWCLHGFLGRPSDWDFLRDDLEIRAVDLFRDGLSALEAAKPEDFLLGYSLGGRLSLLTLLEKSFRGAVIVSAGLNIERADDRAARMREDAAWADRFRAEDWSTVMKAWNAQTVFHGKAEPFERIESDYDRQALASALVNWSPAALPPLASRLPEIATPVLWIAGELDAKYRSIAERAMTLLPHAELWIAPGAGHRVPWDQPAPFIDRVKRFVERGPHVDQHSRV